MYVFQDKPDGESITSTGSIKPVATLKDEHGGISQIAIDDHCYVLYNGSDDRPFVAVKHWFKEAVEALKLLPLPN